MITREFRSLTETEIKNLRASNSWLRPKLSDFLGVAFITLVFYVGGGWYLGRGVDWLVFKTILKNEGTIVFAYVLPVVGLVVAAVSFVRGEQSRRRGLNKVESSLEKSLSDGRAEIVRCTVTRAAELSEYEDEGPGFFLEIAPDLLLFVQGQYLMDLESFPTANITLTRVAYSHELIDLTCSGPHLPPFRRIESAQFGGATWLSDGLIFQGSMDEIPRTLSKWPPKKDAVEEAIARSR